MIKPRVFAMLIALLLLSACATPASTPSPLPTPTSEPQKYLDLPAHRIFRELFETGLTPLQEQERWADYKGKWVTWTSELRTAMTVADWRDPNVHSQYRNRLSYSDANPDDIVGVFFVRLRPDLNFDGQVRVVFESGARKALLAAMPGASLIYVGRIEEYGEASSSDPPYYISLRDGKLESNGTREKAQ